MVLNNGHKKVMKTESVLVIPILWMLIWTKKYQQQFLKISRHPHRTNKIVTIDEKVSMI